jgi:1-acyl-sn-glycerol-3-phosphate acyltransferase
VERPDRVPLKKGEYSVASRALALSTYFLSGALAINLSQFIGTPLYLVNQDWYNAWIAFTKQSFGLLTMTLTQAFAPTKVIVSGDASVRGQLLKSPESNLILNFPSRIILIANHQIYTDWLYLWWIAYCNGMHGRLYIILKESLKKIPVLGWGMQLSQFIFLKRNWEKDKPHMASALQKLNRITEPMWLLLFPEGTNLAPDTRQKSAAWAQKTGVPDMQHMLLPRSTGLQFCLEELKNSVEYLYDCTVAYEGVPRGQYAQDIFTLKAGYLEGRPPKSVSMHWRRFAVKDIPLHNQKVFELWLIARWREKDILMEQYMRTGKFPADVGVTKMKSGEIKRGAGRLEVQIRSSHWYEFLQIFAPMGVLAMVLAVFYGAIPQRFWKQFNKQALQSNAADLKKAGVQAGTQAKAVSGSVAGLTLDDIFDKDKQEDSFKKGALAVGQFLQTPRAQTLLNRVDFMTSFLQNPEKTVTDSVKGQRKNFMKSIAEEEARRGQLKLPTSAQNTGTQKGRFWEDLEALNRSRHGSVISVPSSTSSAKPVGTFWADLKAAERKKAQGLELGARGTFWDKMKTEENSRYGTVRTLSSDASTAVGSVHTISSSPSSQRRLPSIASTLERRPSAPPTLPRRASSTFGSVASVKQPPKLGPPKSANAKPIGSSVNKSSTSGPTVANKAAAVKPPPASKPSKPPLKLSPQPKQPTVNGAASTPKTIPNVVKKPVAVNPSTKPTPVVKPASTMAKRPSLPSPNAAQPPKKPQPAKLNTKPLSTKSAQQGNGIKQSMPSTKPPPKLATSEIKPASKVKT